MTFIAITVQLERKMTLLHYIVVNNSDTHVYLIFLFKSALFSYHLLGEYTKQFSVESTWMEPKHIWNISRIPDDDDDDVCERQMRHIDILALTVRIFFLRFRLLYAMHYKKIESKIKCHTSFFSLLFNLIFIRLFFALSPRWLLFASFFSLHTIQHAPYELPNSACVQCALDWLDMVCILEYTLK